MWGGRFSGPLGRAFVATSLGAEDPFMMIGTSILKHYGYGTLSFSPDESHYGVVGSDSANVHVDDAPITSPGARSVHFSFDGGGRYQAFALRGSRLVRVDGTFQ